MLREQRKKETNSYTQHYSNLCAEDKNKVVHQNASSAYVWMTELATFVFFFCISLSRFSLRSTGHYNKNKHRENSEI